MSKPALSLARNAAVKVSRTASQHLGQASYRSVPSALDLVCNGGNGSMLKAAVARQGSRAAGGDGSESSRRVGATLALSSAAMMLACGSTALNHLEQEDGGVVAHCENAVSTRQLGNPQEMREHYALFNEIGRGGTSRARIAGVARMSVVGAG